MGALRAPIPPLYRKECDLIPFYRRHVIHPLLLWRGVWGRNVSTTEHTRGSMRTRIVALCA
jgi:hypothetical protein